MTSPEHCHTPRSAAVLLSDALEHIDLVSPPGARGPIRMMFRAGIEMCATSRSLLGKPVVHTLALAQSILDASRDEGRT